MMSVRNVQTKDNPKYHAQNESTVRELGGSELGLWLWWTRVMRLKPELEIYSIENLKWELFGPFEQRHVCSELWTAKWTAALLNAAEILLLVQDLHTRYHHIKVKAARSSPRSLQGPALLIIMVVIVKSVNSVLSV